MKTSNEDQAQLWSDDVARQARDCEAASATPPAAAAAMNEPPDVEEEEEATDPRVSVVVLLCASLFELLSASLVCGQQHVCAGLYAYAVAVGVVSTALTTPIALFYFAEPLVPRDLNDALPHLSLLLLAWWIPACFLLTFVTPFTTLCNGYFATVCASVGSFQLCRAHVPLLESALQTLRAMGRSAPPERTTLMMLAISSTAMWVQAALAAALYVDAPATKAWAIIVGVVSSVLCSFYLLLEGLALHRLGFAMLLAGWWCQGIALSFGPNSFTATVNGYLSTWISTFLAFYLVRTVRSANELQPIPSAPPDDEGLGGPTTDYVAGDSPELALEGTYNQLPPKPAEPSSLEPAEVHSDYTRT